MRVEKLANKTLIITTTTVSKILTPVLILTFTQNDPYVMWKKFDPPITPEALERMSFEEKYEGFCVDLIKVVFIGASSK